MNIRDYHPWLGKGNGLFIIKAQRVLRKLPSRDSKTIIRRGRISTSVPQYEDKKLKPDVVNKKGLGPALWARKQALGSTWEQSTTTPHFIEMPGLLLAQHSSLEGPRRRHYEATSWHSPSNKRNSSEEGGHDQNTKNKQLRLLQKQLHQSDKNMAVMTVNAGPGGLDESWGQDTHDGGHPYQWIPNIIQPTITWLFLFSLRLWTLGSWQFLLGNITQGNNVDSKYTHVMILCLWEHGWKMANPFAPQYLLQDPMLSALNQTVIAYIIDMFIRQLQQQKI